MANNNRTLGFEIFKDIESNIYLLGLYDKLLKQYTYQIFDEPIRNEYLLEKEIDDLLIFSDLLSKSNHPDKKENQKKWGQEIVSLLNSLFPHNVKIKAYMQSVLNYCNNYIGLSHSNLSNVQALGFLDEIINQSKKEVLRIPGYEDKYFFVEQKEIYNNFSEQNFSFSAPTSMGKSYLMRMFIKEQIQKNNCNNFAIIVPTKALINEVQTKLIEDLDELLEEKSYRIVTSTGDILLDHNYKFVFIMTPERLLYLLNLRPGINLKYVFVDESHKIVVKDSRSSFYYELINKLSLHPSKTSIFFASPNIPNPDVFLNLVPHNQKIKSKQATYSPVTQIKYLIEPSLKQLKLYNDVTKKVDTIHNINADFDLVKLIRKVGEGKKNLVYFSGVDNTIDNAVEYSKTLQEVDDPVIKQLAKDIEDEIHSDYYLASLVRKGVAYHVGYLPSNIRLRIEKEFRYGKINTIFCTSTLIEGVNMPADNLIVTSYKTGNRNLGDIGFKNLIGRVGRISHNLFGNVFFIKISKDIKMEKYEELLANDVAHQKLSIDTFIKPKQKTQIIESLSKGEIELTNIKTTSREQYDFVRKLSLIFIDNLLDDQQDSLVVKTMSEGTNQDDLNKIKSHYKDKEKSTGIEISYDQTENLENAIKNGLSYPVSESTEFIEYNDVLDFLNKLSLIFRWDIYESGNLGKINPQTQQIESLRYYALLLTQWMLGYGLSNIIDRSIRRNKNKYEMFMRNVDRNIDHDTRMLMFKNRLISNTLRDIDNVILFSLSNYFREFSEVYKKINGLTSFDNDWYEYVEYGSTNVYTITLQRLGYSRESANKIRINKDRYVVDKENKFANFSLKKSYLLDSKNEGLRMETEIISKNVPEIFV